MTGPFGAPVRVSRATLDRWLREKSDDEWINSSGVKSQMQRMDSTFKEKALGFSSFRAFVESRSDVVESQMRNNIQKVRRR